MTPDGPAAGGFLVVPGATSAEHEVTINGRQTHVNRCYVPNRSPEDVLAEYAAQAQRESPGRPFLAERAPDGGGSLLWSTEDGQQKAVIARPDPQGGTTYRLIVDTDGSSPERAALPGGLDEPPPGFLLAFSMLQGEQTGLALLTYDGAPREAANRLLSALARHGFSQDGERSSTHSELAGERLSIPLVHASRRLQGHLVVSPSGAQVRVSLSIQARL